MSTLAGRVDERSRAVSKRSAYRGPVRLGFGKMLALVGGCAAMALWLTSCHSVQASFVIEQFALPKITSTRNGEEQWNRESARQRLVELQTRGDT